MMQILELYSEVTRVIVTIVNCSEASFGEHFCSQIDSHRQTNPTAVQEVFPSIPGRASTRPEGAYATRRI